MFGIDGDVAASADRFLPDALAQVRKAHGKKTAGSDKTLAKKVTASLSADLDVYVSFAAVALLCARLTSDVRNCFEQERVGPDPAL